MKVLWLCNMMLPQIAEQFHLPASNKEGWLAGLMDQILEDPWFQVDLAVAFPTEKELAGKVGSLAGKVTFYTFYEDVTKEDVYDPSLEATFQRMLNHFQPDVIHLFGTEFPHTLAMCRVVEDKRKLLLGIQGLCGEIADAYYAGLPEKVLNRRTFRDRLKKDSIKQQKEKFERRALNEQEAIWMAGNITGRTAWDHSRVEELHPGVPYFKMNETLRKPFYEGRWRRETCKDHSLLLSQGDYPLKGLHYVLLAMAKVRETYPDVSLTVTGNPIIRPKTTEGNLKISSYGLYIRDLIEELGLEKKVDFKGSVDAEGMKMQMTRCNAFICASAIENSPNSLGEAMLLGVPCITAYVGGIPSLFDKDKDGLAFEGYKEDTPEDLERVSSELAKAIIEMFSAKPEKLTMYSETARYHARQTHNPEHNLERLQQIYKSLDREE